MLLRVRCYGGGFDFLFSFGAALFFENFPLCAHCKVLQDKETCFGYNVCHRSVFFLFYSAHLMKKYSISKRENLFNS